jgi:quercetin dioxygenase-like cupin family protein
MALGAMALSLSGCLTARGQSIEDRFPLRRTFQPEKLRRLNPDQTHRFEEFERSGEQSVCLLQLAPDATLTKRYHVEHDLTLFVARGSAIVKVEETRYSVSAGSAVLLPRLTAYTVMPHESGGDFVALLLFSPPFDGEDVALEK